MRSLDPGRQLVLLDQGLPEPRSPPRASRSASTSSAAVSRCPRGTVCQPSRPRGKASASVSMNPRRPICGGSSHDRVGRDPTPRLIDPKWASIFSRAAAGSTSPASTSTAPSGR